MACTVKGELKCKDGRTSRFTVEAENNLKSIIEGVKKISSEISVVLTELVEEERSVNTERGECRARDEDVEDEDEDEDEDGDEEDRDIETTAVKLKSRPPAKRLKTVTPS
ncbi:nucleolin [Ictalurus punctatus]|uniref:Nucleolin n=1 Tax=Ictalurus punctatus TaxID=7998 RepID=A0A2D0PY19_ICTPU|nr:nucleolin [Ictalurus punctatus]